MSIVVTDRQSYQITYREYTDQGYLKVPGKVARIGVQDYLVWELRPEEGQPDPANLRQREDNEVIGVYRPADEVFNSESLATYEDADVTDGHPDDMVTAQSFKDVSLGHSTGPGRADGDYVVCDIILKDAQAIDKVEQGTANLSAGYRARYDYEPGTTQDGQNYEFVQRDIRINHIALVDRARAGAEARLFDHEARGEAMSTITLDGKTITVGDDATAQLLRGTFDAQKEKMDELQSKLKEQEDAAEETRKEMEKLKAEKDEEAEKREEAEKASSDEAIQERLKDVAEARDHAKQIAGNDFTCDSVDPMTVRREALAKVRPTVDWAKQSDEYVQAAWDMKIAEAESDPAKQSHDSLSADMKKLYFGDSDTPVGDSAYQKFLNGEVQ